MTDTIYALASGAGRAGVAVFRLSGPKAGQALATLTRRAVPPPRKATRVTLRNGEGEVIDDGLALWFPAPRSFTGEDVAEIHGHGGRAVATALSAALSALGLRPAEPGEFTRRAFDNGKLDLTRAEAIADLVDAETAAQRRQALRQMQGALAVQVEAWRDALVRALGHFEAAIDFSDEDIPEDLEGEVRHRMARLAEELQRRLAEGERGERLRHGLQVALVGAPNVGKSSLLNRLAGREAAIVSDRAGTTRDVIEVHLDLGGYPVTVADTAGLRTAAEDIEAEGVRRALERAERADVKLAVFDASHLPRLDSDTLAVVDEATVVVMNKMDQATAVAPDRVAGRPVVAVSARTGANVAGLEIALREAARRSLDGEGAALLTRERHRAAVVECLGCLERFGDQPQPELAAEELRLAARALGRITGRVDVEDLLDVIFRDFCIGK